MKHRFKALGTAVVSVLALSAIAASAASAAELHSAVHPQTINGTQSTGHVFTTNSGTVSCKKASFTGTTSASTSTNTTVSPDYNECTAFGFINVPIHENGCGYISGAREIECPEGKKMEITAPFCTTTIGPQTLAGGMSFANNAGKTDVIATINIKTEIDYNECGTARTNGSYTGTSTVTGASGSIWYE
jgi:hypothetical protein